MVSAVGIVQFLVGGDTLEFGRFLESTRRWDAQCVGRDPVAYRAHRFTLGASPRSWARQPVFVRAFFTYRYETGSRSTLPWIRVGNRSVVTPRIPQTEMDVRALSHAQWIALRNIGFGGQLPTGERKRGVVWAKLGPDGWIVPLGPFVGRGGFRRRNGESNRVG